MKRIVLITAGVVGVAVVGAIAMVIFVLSSLDGLVQEAVETYGSEITQAEVKLAEVELDATSGKGALRGLKVGNPAGFNTPSAFELGAVSIIVDTDLLAGDTVVIKEVIIEAPDVTYELGADGSNIDAIQRNVEAYMARFDGGNAAGANDDGEGPELIIEDLYIRNGTVNVSATFLQGKTLSAPLPDIHLEDIGKEEDGASPGEVAEQIIASIKDGAAGAVSGLGLDGMLGAAGESLEGLAEGAGAMLEGVTGEEGGAMEGVTEGAGEAIEGITEGAGEAIKGAGEAIEGLFGGSSD